MVAILICFGIYDWGVCDLGCCVWFGDALFTVISLVGVKVVYL